MTDDATPEEQLPRLITAAVAGGADVVQLRRKQTAAADLTELARACRDAAHAGGALFIVDDHVELARAIQADGVHLGQADLDPETARARLGPELLIGLSTHSRSDVTRASKKPVDYLAAGPVNATPTKPGRPAVGFDHVRTAASWASVPVVAIGGLGRGSAGQAVAAGADMVGVVRAICTADDPAGAARELREEIQAAPRWVELELNGEPRRCPPGSSMVDLLARLEVGVAGVVVEINGGILRPDELARVEVVTGDQVEVVHLVGGGKSHD